MELFTKTKVVKLRSHLDKYLHADNDGETVRQSRNGVGNRRNSKWVVEVVETRQNAVRLKTLNGKYLTGLDEPFLLGETGKRVVQTVPEKLEDWKLEWEVVRDGFQLKLKSWCGKVLRANGGPPPWRNSVTHDHEPRKGSSPRWILWDVEPVEVVGETIETVKEYLSFMSSFSSIPEDVLEAVASDNYNNFEGSESESPVSVAARTPRLTFVKSMPSCFSPRKTNWSKSTCVRSGMDFFRKAKTVRFRSHHDKYLHADPDEETVTQDRDRSTPNSHWTVEPVPDLDHVIRVKSCYNKYLTASNQPFLLGVSGRKVLQTVPSRLDSSVEWEPIREGNQVKMKTRYGNFLRANGGVPPWRNSVTHDIPHRSSSWEWVLWEVEVVGPVNFEESSSLSSSDSGLFSRQESSDSYVSSPPKSEGRTIFYHVVDESADVNVEAVEGYSVVFKGNGVEELTQRLREETGLEDIVVCTRSPLNGKLYPLRLQLPPNNADMHVIVVENSSKVARDFAKIAL